MLGLPNAADWVVQDDGFGFPCFYNLQTEAVVYEDPRSDHIVFPACFCYSLTSAVLRFVYDVDEDVAVQRQYVMQVFWLRIIFSSSLWRC